MAIIKVRGPAFPGSGFTAGKKKSGISVFENEMNRLFDHVFGKRIQTSQAEGFPAVNIFQDSDNLYLTAELPGMNPEEIHLVIKHDTIHLQGERRIEPEGGNGRYHRREREGGQFSRTLRFPVRINARKVSARMKHGILEVVLPKVEENRFQKIKISDS